MVLIATQLGVKDAVDRIAQSEKGGQESVQMLEQQYISNQTTATSWRNVLRI